METGRQGFTRPVRLNRSSKRFEGTKEGLCKPLDFVMCMKCDSMYENGVCPGLFIE